jgi:hypothetical protein
MAADTHERIAYIQDAIQDYYTVNGRYPCPAPLTADIDVAGFGREVGADCTAAPTGGTFRAQGRDGRWVRTGTIPARTLNIPDKYSFDDYGKRLIYAVTEQYAVQGSPVAGDAGAITILDGNGNNATADPGNVIQVVFSMGDDPNGAYNVNGLNIQACDTSVVSGENCDFDSDATFMNTVSKSRNEQNGTMFVHDISYIPHRHVLTCEEANQNIKRAKNTSFLVDTSGSMAWAGKGSDGHEVKCPSDMPGCSRVDVARWALRRTVPAHIYNNSLEDEPGATSLTGFVAKDNVKNVEKNLGDITFDDPSDPDYTAPDDNQVLAELEPELQGMCPDGSTPLGIHMMALANRLHDQMVANINNGGDPEQFSKIIVFSDGESNDGMSPLDAAKEIVAMRDENPPIQIQVDIIDVVGNDKSLRTIAETTGGAYYNTANPDELLDALYAASGICSSHTPVTPTDKQGCGSAGNWWNKTN